MPGIMREHVGDRAHPAKRGHLLQEVLEGEGAPPHELGGHALPSCLVERGLGLLDEGQYVAMPRMRLAIRSGWKTSKSSNFSPVEANMIGCTGDLHARTAPHRRGHHRPTWTEPRR
jgi:hypothetical protein